ncbi:MAG TPA: hypothetical protein VJB14_00405 [Planctomycetota bacterium]|nr:hypothetical protein [Planctomycetota bacterium]
MTSNNSLLVGQIALELRLVGREQLQQCLDYQAGQVQPKPIGALLVQNGFLTETQMERVLDEQRRRFAEGLPHAPATREALSFGKLVVQHGHARPENVSEALRAQQDLAERGIRRRLGELLVAAGRLPAEAVPAILKMQGKTLMACTFCGAHFNVLSAIAEGYPCRECGMPLAEKTVSISAYDTAYLMPAVDPRARPETTRREPAPAKKEALQGTGGVDPGREERNRRVMKVLLLVFLLFVAAYLLSRSGT